MGPRSGIAFPPGALMGERWVHIGTETLLGPNVSLAVGMPGEQFDADGPVIVIGDRCNIGRGSSIVARCHVAIEDDVTIAPNVYITDHNHAYEDVDVPISQQMPIEAPVRIGAGSWLATGATVLPGADIGRNVTVAAGAVVRGRVPDFAVVAGVPGRVVRHYEPGAGWVTP
jgi:acetyltransferase-like isoleucine patch superfamily enzyme